MFVKGKNLCDTCTNHSYFDGCTGDHYVEKTEVVIVCDEYEKDETIEEDDEEED